MSQNAIRQLGLAGLVAAISLAAGVDAARAAVVTPLNLQKPPLFLNSSVDPNIAVTFDDSGSMTSAFMPDSVDDSCAYRHPKFYSSVYNRIYYNPNTNYSPPLKPDGNPFPAASFTAAWQDGYEANTAIVTGGAGSPTVDLRSKYFPTRTMNSRSNSNGTRITNRTETTGTPSHLRGGPAYVGTGAVLNCTSTFTDDNTAWLPFAASTGTGGTSKAFYYRFTGDPASATDINDATKYVAVDVAANGEQQNFANWYSYYKTRTLLGRTAMTRVFGVQGQNLRVAFQNLNTSTYRFAAGTTQWLKFTGTARSNFFQWLYREDANGTTPLRASTIRAGEVFKYGSSAITDARNPYYEDAPVARELTCRQNFHITLTDGFWNEGNPTYSGINDTTSRTLPDGTSYTQQAPYGNDAGNDDLPTLADITFNYWATDLRTNLGNQVPPYIKNPSATPATQFFDPENDPANWQHVVQYIVGLGVAGTRAFPGDYAALKAGTLNWPAVSNNTASAVDDAWHAALNSRGTYFSAADPDELVDSLNNVLQSVLVRQGTASAATVTSGIIQASTLAFRTAFDSSDWSGQVVGYKVNESGRRIEPPVWDAGATLNARTAERKILTSSGPTGGGIPFRYANLPTAYVAKLNDNPATVAVDNDGLASQRVDWLRGDQTREQPNGPFRVRTKKLGAIVNSGAVVVAGPSAAYNDKWPAGSPELATVSTRYSAFRSAQRNRGRVVYVGANDGMLHAFEAGTGTTSFDASGNPIVNAGSGEELFAYVPYETAGSLSQLT
ncbi:MAG TPA: PilC/PilY family type IV pilus protein, partial [Xanthomonadales bacterium]|nr:PilC/PilY family type IV pilus protein [Xanthomonadales bacterium]